MRKMIVLTLLLLLFVSGVTQAQEMQVPCGTLAEADCQLLRDSQTAGLGLTSYNFQFQAELNLENIPDSPSPLVISLAGDGSVAGDWSSMQTMQAEMMSAMSDPEAYGELLQNTLGQIGLDLNLVLTLPEEIVAQAGGQIPAAIPLELRLVEGSAYLNMDPLREALGAEMSAQIPPGWMGIDLVGFATAAVAQQAASGDMMGGMEDAAAMQTEMMAAFTNPDFLNQFMTVERGADMTAPDGSQAAVFQTSLDFGALMSSPEMQDMITQSMAASGEEVDAAELQMGIAMATQMMEGLNFSIVQTIGVDDKFARSVEVTFDWDMTALGAMMAAQGDTSMGDTPPVIGFHALITYSDFNAADPITAPENAMLIPLESMGMGE
jgi:hypothetical protein